MRKPGKRSSTFEFKLEIVRRLISGEATALELAREPARPAGPHRWCTPTKA